MKMTNCVFKAINRQLVFAAGALSLFLSSISYAAVPTLVYDHAGTNSSVFDEVEVEAGEYFIFLIDNTCDAVASNWEGIPRATPPVAAISSQSFADEDKPSSAYDYFEGQIDCELDSKPRKLEIPHSAANGGYVIRLTNAKKPGEDVIALKVADGEKAKKVFDDAFELAFKDKTTPKDYQQIQFSDVVSKLSILKKLNEVSITVGVNQVGWTYEFAGGATVSELTSPRFATETRNIDGVDQQFVIRDKSAEDTVNPGFATFVHLNHSRFERWSPLSFGLGLNDESDANFFIGTSYRLGGKGFITLGYNVGKVDRLPTGTLVDEAITDPNVLADLPSRTDGAVFLSFTYSFLGNGLEALQKPFADPKPPPAQPGSNAPADDADPPPDPDNDNVANEAGSEEADLVSAEFTDTDDYFSRRNYSDSCRSSGLDRAIEKWRSAWENQDLQEYNRSYSNFFDSEKGTFQEWLRNRRAAISAPRNIKVDVFDVVCRVEGNIANARFTQHYQSNLHRDEVEGRRLMFTRDGYGEWKITRESNR